MKNNKKGFTLAELLVVVGIIAVLIAIAIPVFTNQLEKSREAVDAANIRSAYAEVVSQGLVDTSTATTVVKNVNLKQQTAGWESTPEFPANLTVSTSAGSPIVGGHAVLTYTKATGTIELSFAAGQAS